mmetsp:Transcript_45991/g.148129  ORF Transcript_45991/g.148129 Transcript_45991/m.148129 type:complete len:233 (-) Transcript_45991:83-781(-)
MAGVAHDHGRKGRRRRERRRPRICAALHLVHLVEPAAVGRAAVGAAVAVSLAQRPRRGAEERPRARRKRRQRVEWAGALAGVDVAEAEAARPARVALAGGRGRGRRRRRPVGGGGERGGVLADKGLELADVRVVPQASQSVSGRVQVRRIRRLMQLAIGLSRRPVLVAARAWPCRPRPLPLALHIVQADPAGGRAEAEDERILGGRRDRREAPARVAAESICRRPVSRRGVE